MLQQKLFWFPVSLYIALIIPIVWWDIDWQLANYWYQLEGQQWTLRSAWLTQRLLHDGGHNLAVGLYIIVLLLFGFSFKSGLLAKYKAGLAYLSLSLPLATLTVSLIKRLTSVSCPWSVTDFGGQQQYQSLFHSLWSPIAGAGHCFPSGHASSAYMFFGLYFFSCHYWPTKSTLILVLIITVGLIFGFDQQIRGAHYISHDLSSALICWLVCWFIWYVRVNTWTNKSA
jgi:membrane-associated PAP2 superfamily phosphatase